MESSVHTPAGDVLIRRGSAEEVVDLRHAVLRAGLPRETAMFPGDEHLDARHVVAVARDGRVVGCVTVHPSTWDGTPAWQLRGMATAQEVRGSGVGRAMLESVIDLVSREFRAGTMWCNARVPAAGFYERHGWTIVSDVYEIPTAGPHVKMTKSPVTSG